MAITRLNPFTAPRRRNTRWALTALCSLACFPAVALEFDPTVSLTALYSDNIRLADENPQDDVVLSASPGIGIYHYGQRVTLEADYLYQWFWYDDAAEGDARFGNGSAALGLEVIPDKFFWDSFATQSQTYKDPLSAIPNTNADLTANRADVFTMETSPRLTLPLFSTVFDTQWSLGRVDYDDADLQDADYIDGRTKFRSEQDQPGIQWSIDHTYTRYEYDLPPVANRQELTLELGYDFGSWTVFGRGGRESPFIDPTDDSLTDNIWIGGLRYAGPRTSFEAYGGDRSFGSTFGASFTQDINRGLLAFNYDELPFRSEQIFGIRRQPNSGALVPPDPLIPEIPDQNTDINTPGRGSIFVRKRATVSITKYTNRNEVGLLVFWERREDEILQDGTAAPADTSTTGFRIDWTYTLGRRTTTGANLGFSDRKIDDPTGKLDDKFIGAQVFLSRQLGNSLNGRIYYAYRERDGDISSTANYKANEVGITFTAEFGKPTIRPLGARDLGR